MAVSLRPVTPDNFRAVVQLRPTPDQAAFIETNHRSLAEAVYLPAYQPMTICDDETPVGFLMWFAEGGGNYWLDRFMIDQHHQGKGYGRAALNLILAQLGSRPDCTAIYLSHVEGNNAAGRFYQAFGFEYTGERDENDERIMRLTVQQPERVQLKPAGREDLFALLALELDEAQMAFVAPNSYSLAQAHFQPERRFQPLAVYSGGALVGFVMVNAAIEDDDHLWIYRLMIDRRQQRKGYGRAAMQQTIAHLQALIPDQPRPVRGIAVSFEPENTVAAALYSSLGFLPTGRVLDGETVVALSVSG